MQSVYWKVPAFSWGFPSSLEGYTLHEVLGGSVQLLPLSVVDGDLEMTANFPEGGEGEGEGADGNPGREVLGNVRWDL